MIIAIAKQTSVTRLVLLVLFLQQEYATKLLHGTTKKLCRPQVKSHPHGILMASQPFSRHSVQNDVNNLKQLPDLIHECNFNGVHTQGLADRVPK